MYTQAQFCNTESVSVTAYFDHERALAVSLGSRIHNVGFAVNDFRKRTSNFSLIFEQLLDRITALDFTLST